jgi:hypothetical protein
MGKLDGNAQFLFPSHGGYPGASVKSTARSGRHDVVQGFGGKIFGFFRAISPKGIQKHKAAHHRCPFEE